MLKRTRLSLAISAAFGAGLVGLAPAVFAQGTVLERAEITGSSLRRTDAETALPVTIIKAEDLIRQGITTVEQAMKTIPQNQSAIGVSQGIGAQTAGLAVVDLRGLGASTGSAGQRTLVLLNGRRVANQAFDSGATDLNSIPMSAIDRIEILRDGASAIYGTDAIGGVVNFILRREYSGVEIYGEYQNPEQSGGVTQRAGLTVGYGSLEKQGFNVMATLDWRDQEAVLAADRPFGSSGIVPDRNQFRTSGTTFPATVSGFNPSAPNCNPPSSVWNGTACRYDFVRDIDLIPENQQLSTLLRGTLKLGDHYISAEYLYSKLDTINRVAPTPNVGLTIPNTSPFYPAGATGNIVNWRTTTAGKRTDDNEATADRILLEANGLIAGWDYKAGIFQSKSEITQNFTDGYVRSPIIEQGVLDGTLNPFGPQTAAGSALLGSAKVLGEVTTAEGKVTTIDARASKDIFQMAGGASALAIGTEWRKEEFSYDLKDLAREAASSGLELANDISGDRDVFALYAEMAFPITKTFEVTLAARYDDYSDFGGTFNPKVGLRWQPMKSLLVRGSYNTGFRAPTLYDVYQPIANTFTSDSYDDPLYCPGGTAVGAGVGNEGVVCDQQVQARLAGPVAIGKPADTLQPEESDTWTVGLVFEPMTNMTFSVDYWNIKIDNLISVLPEQAIFGDVNKYASRIRRCGQLAPAERSLIDVCANFSATLDPIAYIDQPTENLGEMKTSGIDFGFGYRFPATEYGNFGIQFDGTYVMNYEYQRESGGEFIEAVGKYTDNAPVFRWQHSLVFSWGVGPWGVTVAQNYKSGYTDQTPNNEVETYQLWDATLTYTGIKNLTLMGGVRNLADKDPPYSNQATTFQSNYDPRFTDAIGRTWVFRAAYKFF